jgi:hypothetical protein
MIILNVHDFLNIIDKCYYFIFFSRQHYSNRITYNETKKLLKIVEIIYPPFYLNCLELKRKLV